VKKLLLSALLVIALSLCSAGCASTRYFRQAGVSDWTVGQVLHRSLDRWVGWRSLYAEFKLTVTSGDTTATTRGHLIYLMGERIEFGFHKPWNKFIGAFYVLPDRTLYWGTSSVPAVYGLSERVELARLMPLPFADWDPRDILPFPISGRTGGLQPDSVWVEGTDSIVRASAPGVMHWLALNTTKGLVESEVVQRAEREIVYKEYRRFTTVNGWPIPSRVSCADSSGRHRVDWSLSKIKLDAQPYVLDDPLETFSSPPPSP
jgi:hypothetical protein